MQAVQAFPRSRVDRTGDCRARSVSFGFSQGCAAGVLAVNLSGPSSHLWSRLMLTRRSFLKLTGASTIAWYVAAETGWTQRALAQIPGGTLDPGDVAKFQTPLLIPPVMPRAATLRMPGGKPADYYEISMRQFTQQILPAGLPETTVWGYGPVSSA